MIVKVKNGDRVRVVKVDDVEYEKYVGLEGFVVDVDEKWSYPVEIKFDDEKIDDEIFFGHDELEIIADSGDFKHVEDRELYGEFKPVPIRMEVANFAMTMEKVLAERDELHPDGWKNDEPESLFNSLVGKAIALQTGMNEDNKEKIIKSSVDIANFAMMIADVTKGK